MLVGVVLISEYQVLSLFFLTFPNGRFYGRWNIIPFILICLNSFFWIVQVKPLNIEYWPVALASAWLLVVYGSHLVVQVVRYRRMYTHVERQQTKWLLYGFSVPIVLFAVISLRSAVNAGAPLHPIAENTLVIVLYLPIGLAVGIALLRYRLWDVDVVINRTLVYGALTAILVAIYALIVTALGRLLQDEGSFAVSLIGAGVLAVLFQPLRDGLQRGINRLLFGRRSEPLAVMTALSRNLEAILTPEAALAHLVEETARSLKLPYVGLERAGHPEPIAFGASRLEPVRFPLIVQAQPIGALLAVPRSPAEGLNSADRLILEQVARQAGQVVQLSRLTDDLQRSRQDILSTREEERRRLRRDLHDGLGPALATLTLQAEAAKEWLTLKPETSTALLDEIIAGTQQTLADIRRIVYDLRPPALDDLGLVSAIREQAARYASDDLLITVEAPDHLPALPAAVEVATYRIVQEALTNVRRHAQARTCQVQLAINGRMEIAVVDDGVGLPSPNRSGVGLYSIHERAAELGGSCAIESQPGAGTQVRVWLPRELAF
jgi:signal transduction histidine kinase